MPGSAQSNQVIYVESSSDAEIARRNAKKKKPDFQFLQQFVSLLERDQQDDSILQPPLLLYSMFSRDRFLNYTILYNI